MHKKVGQEAQRSCTRPGAEQSEVMSLGAMALAPLIALMILEVHRLIGSALIHDKFHLPFLTLTLELCISMSDSTV